MLRRLILPLSFLLASSGAFAATDLVTNGSFEQGAFSIGSFQGWTTQLGDGATFVDSNGKTGSQYGDAFDGVWSAFFGSTALAGGSSISQDLATAGGESYLLTFDLANDNGGQGALNAFSASVDGKTAVLLSNAADQAYSRYSFGFVATSGVTPLVITASNDNGFFDLDNVSVSQVPEPCSLLLVLPATLLLFKGTKRVGK